MRIPHCLDIGSQMAVRSVSCTVQATFPRNIFSLFLSLVIISVRCGENPQGLVKPEELRKLIKFDLSGSRTRDFLACDVIPHPLRYYVIRIAYIGSNYAVNQITIIHTKTSAKRCVALELCMKWHFSTIIQNMWCKVQEGSSRYCGTQLPWQRKLFIYWNILYSRRYYSPLGIEEPL